MAHKITKPLTGLLTDEHDPDLRAATTAVTAFWQAVNTNQDWWNGQGFGPVINCCILSTLAVRDILHGMGRSDAVVLKSGLHIQAFKEARPYRSITIGSPLAPRIPGHWNAHMVVKFGNLIIDPTLGQARRSWNGLPESAVFENHTGAGGQLRLTEDCSVHVTAQRTRRKLRAPRSLRGNSIGHREHINASRRLTVIQTDQATSYLIINWQRQPSQRPRSPLTRKGQPK